MNANSKSVKIKHSSDQNSTAVHHGGVPPKWKHRPKPLPVAHSGVAQPHLSRAKGVSVAKFLRKGQRYDDSAAKTKVFHEKAKRFHKYQRLLKHEGKQAPSELPKVAAAALDRPEDASSTTEAAPDAPMETEQQTESANPRTLTQRAQQIREQKQQLKEEKDRERVERSKLAKEKRQQRYKQMGKLVQRNSKGQPVLKNMIEHMLHKLEQQQQQDSKPT